VKYAWIDEHRDSYPVAVMCDVLNVSTSGYYSSLDRPPAHAVAQDHIAVLQGIDDGPVPVMVFVGLSLLALSTGMGSESVVPYRPPDDLLVLDLEDEEGSAAAKVMRDGYAVLGSNCNSHRFYSLLSV